MQVLTTSEVDEDVWRGSAGHQLCNDDGPWAPPWPDPAFMSADCRRSSSLDAPRSTVLRSSRRRADDTRDRLSEDRTVGSSHAGERATRRWINRSIDQLIGSIRPLSGKNPTGSARKKRKQRGLIERTARNLLNARRSYYGCVVTATGSSVIMGLSGAGHVWWSRWNQNRTRPVSTPTLRSARRYYRRFLSADARADPYAYASSPRGCSSASLLP